jgi:hypothetical protein
MPFTHEWLASSLQEEGKMKMPAPEAFQAETTTHWIHGPQGTGNLLDAQVIRAIVTRAATKTLFVTADGGMDCDDDPSSQETRSFALIFAEVATALQVLAPGGILFVKFFSIFETPTVWLVWLLSQYFTRSEMVKPIMSRSCNSESYFVGLGFMGQDAARKIGASMTTFLESIVSAATPLPSSSQFAAFLSAFTNEKASDTKREKENEKENEFVAGQERSVARQIEAIETHIQALESQSHKAQKVRQGQFQWQKQVAKIFLTRVQARPGHKLTRSGSI